MRKRQLFTIGLMVLALYFLYAQLDNVQQVGEHMQRGNLLWLVLAALTQLVWLVNATAMYRSVYRLLGMEISLRELLPVVATGYFVNVIAPTGGMSGIAIFLADSQRRKLSSSRVTVAGVLGVLFDYFGFLCVLAVGLLVLLRRNSLSLVNLSAAGLLLLTALAIAGLLILGARSAKALERVLIYATRLVNRGLYPCLHRPYLSEARAHSFAAASAEGLSALRTHWSEYLLPAALALLGKVLMIGILCFAFLAFGQPISVGSAIAGFSIAFLFTIVSPTPLGLGVVEVIMPATLIALRVSSAAAITLAYRGITFWLPFGYGFIALRIWQHQHQSPPTPAPPAAEP